MREYHRKIDKIYQKAPFEIEDGLSTYDLQLLSLTKKSKKNRRVINDQFEEIIAA